MFTFYLTALQVSGVMIPSLICMFCFFSSAKLTTKQQVPTGFDEKVCGHEPSDKVSSSIRELIHVDSRSLIPYFLGHIHASTTAYIGKANWVPTKMYCIVITTLLIIFCIESSNAKMSKIACQRLGGYTSQHNIILQRKDASKNWSTLGMSKKAPLSTWTYAQHCSAARAKKTQGANQWASQANDGLFGAQMWPQRQPSLGVAQVGGLAEYSGNKFNLGQPSWEFQRLYNH